MNNYYSIAHDKQYMSCSQLDHFDKCEASYVAYLKGDNPNKQSSAMLLGNYLHSWAEGKLEEFKLENPELFLRTGGLKSEYKLGDTMIKTLEQDKYCMYMLQGESEVTFTGNLYGIDWKIRVDKWNTEKYRIIDLKTTKNIWDKVWIEGQKVSFLEVYNYQRRAAVYSEIIRQSTGRTDLPGFFIVAVSKEDPPDKAIIDMTDTERWQLELHNIQQKIPRLKLIRDFKLEPLRCEKCDYCKRTKSIKKVISYKEI